MEKIIIIGSGPAGLTAAIYTARAGLAPLLFEGVMAGGSAGGQLTTTTEVENYPGFPEGVPGPALMEKMKAQAEKYGTHFLAEDVVSAGLSGPPFKVRGTGTAAECRALIIATGAVAIKMDIPSGERLWNRGISACAVCDGALPIFRNRPLLVVGGGDSALEEALYLTRFASRVFIAHRRDQLRASGIMQKRAVEHPKIEILWNTVLEDARGDQKVEAAMLKDVKSGATRELPVSGVFYGIGHRPNTAFLGNALEMDNTGYIIVKPGTTLTSVPGVFACGDVQDRRYRQAVTAAGSGCMAALDAQKYLEEAGE